MSMKDCHSIKRFLFLIGLSLLFSACSTSMDSNRLSYYEREGNARVGMRYLLGRGLPQDNTKAFYYFNRAANEDDPFAQNELAYLYAAGKGTTQDYSKALYWYQKASNHGLASAQYNLGLFYLYGLGTNPNRSLAMKWFKKSAAHGFEPARKALS